MNETAQFVFAIRTGNLPSALVTSAVQYESKVEVKAEPQAGTRFVFVGYKIGKTAKGGEVQPANFYVTVNDDPTALLSVNGSIAWLHDLARDYQDKMIHASADKETAIDPTDWRAMIADYYDNTRTRSGVTLKDMKDWIKETFEYAFISRQTELQVTALAEGRIQKTNKQIEQLTKGFCSWMEAVCVKQCLLGHQVLNGLRQTLDRLCELGHLQSDDAILKEFQAKIAVALQTPEMVYEDSIC